mmetsp:Transcript_2281/g.4804  ORF Transcript_2281/g.4804 Transcript_2281/m.4804 type:complete len:142 (-) Transcript_2281:752-1177(-)
MEREGRPPALVIQQPPRPSPCRLFFPSPLSPHRYSHMISQINTLLACLGSSSGGQLNAWAAGEWMGKVTVGGRKPLCLKGDCRRALGLFIYHYVGVHGELRWTLSTSRKIAGAGPIDDTPPEGGPRRRCTEEDILSSSGIC